VLRCRAVRGRGSARSTTSTTRANAVRALCRGSALNGSGTQARASAAAGSPADRGEEASAASAARSLAGTGKWLRKP
jgi:hypothetical protein